VTEPTEFPRYRVKLRKALFGVSPRRMWCKWVKLGRPQEYERQEVVRRFGDTWEAECGLALLNPNFEIEGQDAQGNWEPLSSWRLEELRQARDVAAAVTSLGGEPLGRKRRLAMIVRQMFADRAAARGRKPSQADAAAHLLDCEGLVHEDAVQVMKDLGWKDVDVVKLPGYARHGRRRRDEGHGCPFTKMS
jgi:hypothetical protein